MVWSNKLLLASSSLILPGDLDAANGGYRAYNNFGDGLLYNLNTAAKSTETSLAWQSSPALITSPSRVNGTLRTESIGSDPNLPAFQYSFNLVFGSQTDWYLGAIDELRAIASVLRPSVATKVPFQTGGSEEFVNGSSTYWWSSTEIDSTAASVLSMNTGTTTVGSKTTSYFVRPIRRFATSMPYPIGTAMLGGYLAAYFTDLSTGSPLTYMLIVADKTTETTKVWDGSGLGVTNYKDRTNGIPATNAMTNPAFAAGKYCLDLVSGGQTDWYLGAIDEYLSIARMNASLPSGQQLLTSAYWSSTEVDANNAIRWQLSVPEFGGQKGIAVNVRPIRRVLLP